MKKSIETILTILGFLFFLFVLVYPTYKGVVHIIDKKIETHKQAEIHKQERLK